MGTIISRFSEKTKSDDKTTCISITAETYKCIDISVFAPTCITITSNVPSSPLYEEQYNREVAEYIPAAQIEVILINNKAPELGVNIDEFGNIYVQDFDVIYYSILNYEEGNVYDIQPYSLPSGSVFYVDYEEERIIWAIPDTFPDGYYAEVSFAVTNEKYLGHPQGFLTCRQMLHSLPVEYLYLGTHYEFENETVPIYIVDYNPKTEYFITVSGGVVNRVAEVIYWTIPEVVIENELHIMEISQRAELQLEGDKTQLYIHVKNVIV